MKFDKFLDRSALAGACAAVVIAAILVAAFAVTPTRAAEVSSASSMLRESGSATTKNKLD